MTESRLGRKRSLRPTIQAQSLSFRNVGLDTALFKCINDVDYRLTARKVMILEEYLQVV